MRHGTFLPCGYVLIEAAARNGMFDLRTGIPCLYFVNQN